MQEVELADRQQDDARAKVDRLPKQVVNRRELKTHLNARTFVGFGPDAVLDLELRRHLEAVRNVRVEERHEPLLVEAATAIAGAGLPDASGIAAVEQAVLDIHVPADRCPWRGHERLGVDELAAPGAADAQRLLARLHLFFFLFAFPGFLALVLDELLHQLLQPPDPLLERLLGLLIGCSFKWGAAQEAGCEGPDDG